jgi:hypothetical protein
MLFSAILGSVFGIMSAVGGVMEFTEEKIQARARNRLNKIKQKRYVTRLSRHASFIFKRLPIMSPTDLNAKASTEINGKDLSHEMFPLDFENIAIEQNEKPSVEDIIL